MGSKDQLSLWEKAFKQRDKNAFSAMYYLHQPDLYICSAKFLGNRESAQNVLHVFFSQPLGKEGHFIYSLKWI